jgi:hypothetical protein
MVEAEAHNSQKGGARTDGPGLNLAYWVVRAHWDILGLVDGLDLDHRIVGSQYHWNVGTVPARVQESI